MAASPWLTVGNINNLPTDFLGTQDVQPLIIKTSGTERIRVNANGKVGIGIMDPAGQLSLGNYNGIRQLVWDGDLNNSQDVNCGFGIDLTGIGNFDIFMSRFYGLSIVAPTGPWPYPGYSAKLTVLPNGNVGVGTTTPAESLDVRGNIKLGGQGQLFALGGLENLLIIHGQVDGQAGGVFVGGGLGFTVSRAGTGQYTVSLSRPVGLNFTSFCTWQVTPVDFSGSQRALTAVITSTSGGPGPTDSTMTVSIFDSSGNLVDSFFHFIALQLLF